MTIREKIIEVQKKLSKNGIKDHRLESEIILSLALDRDRLFLISSGEQEIKTKEDKKINKLLQQRLDLYPLAYLAGKKSFFELEFEVSPDTLIPRPESELIIEKITKNASQQNKPQVFIDVGTGSGCLIISLANLFKERANYIFYGLDICPQALRVARKNSRKHQLEKKINFIESDLLKKIIILNKKDGFINNSELTIVANLPYLIKKEIKESPSIKFEPLKALYGGPDGLKFYRQLIQQLKQVKKEMDNKITVYMEISPWQKNILLNYIKNNFKKNKAKMMVAQDLGRRDRLVILEI